MTDSFARSLGREAIRHAREADTRSARIEDDLRELLARTPRRRLSVFYGKCGLCGSPSGTANYCPAHHWAEGS